jgi:hypothetical protein
LWGIHVGRNTLVAASNTSANSLWQRSLLRVTIEIDEARAKRMFEKKDETK